MTVGRRARRHRRVVRPATNLDPARDPAAEREEWEEPGVQPGQTVDDTDAGWAERPAGRQHDRWLHEQRPPHWE